MIDPTTLGPVPRRVRQIAKYRYRRNAILVVAMTAMIVLLAILGTIGYHRLSLLRHARLVRGTVQSHHITTRRVPQFTLFVAAPFGADVVNTQVDVDPATYDAVWIGQDVDFYLDATNPQNTSQDPPSAWKLAGLFFGTLLVGGILIAATALAALDDVPKGSETQRNALANYETGRLWVKEFEKVGQGGLASGALRAPTDRRWKVRGMPLHRVAEIGDAVPVLFDIEKGKVIALESITDFEIRA